MANRQQTSKLRRMAGTEPKRRRIAIEIREMELEDLARVYRLGERLFTAERWPNLYRTWDEYELVAFFAEDVETCFVAESEGRLVGFVLGTILEKRRSAWSYGWVVWLGVDPDYSRHGIGQRLVEKLTERFIEDGVRILLVDTDAKNDTAIQFFQRQGFGNLMQHVYMTMNLTRDPEYAKQLEQVRLEAKPRRQGSTAVATKRRRATKKRPGRR